MRLLSTKIPRWANWTLVGLLVIFVTGVIAWWLWPRPQVPSSIIQQANFTVYYPLTMPKGLTIDHHTLKYDTTNHGFAYVAMVNTKPVTISEEATPDSFNDGPVYSYLLQKSKEYAEISTSFGTVTLTRPTELNGVTVAIANTNGTLIFARQDGGKLSQDEWAILFNSLKLVK
jgi:hypothetical protein